MLTVPEYYKRFINRNVDLTLEPKQCCPFHKEDTPSFSYSPERGTWRCFGACHAGGDVIELHKLNYHLKSREEARASLLSILGIKEEVTFEVKRPEPNENEVRKRLLYHKALECARDVDSWLELDYIMSIYPLDLDKLDTFIKRRA